MRSKYPNKYPTTRKGWSAYYYKRGSYWLGDWYLLLHEAFGE